MTKIGLDIHGVIDVNPEFFISLSESTIKNGGEIHIITGGSLTDGTIEKELLELHPEGKVWWTKLFSVYDYLKEIKAKTNEELGIATHYPFPDETWNSVKACYCKKNKISMHIDDMLEYLQYFETPYMLFQDKSRNHKGQYGKHD